MSTVFTILSRVNGALIDLLFCMEKVIGSSKSLVALVECDACKQVGEIYKCFTCMHVDAYAFLQCGVTILSATHVFD